MKLIKKPTFINSTVAFVLAGMVVTTVHEMSHLSAAIILGDTPAKIFPNFVIPPDATSTSHQILIAATGPLFSLISGLVIIWWLKSWLKGPASGFSKLFAVWLGFLSAETGFGYFLIAPFVSGGDTGQVLSLLHAPGYVYIIVLAIGALGVYFVLPRLLSARLSLFARDKKSFFELSMHPFWMGTMVLLVIYALIDVVILTLKTGPSSSFGVIFGLVGIATCGVFAPLADYNPKAAGAGKFKLVLHRPVVGIIAVIVVALGLILGLARGLQV